MSVMLIYETFSRMRTNKSCKKNKNLKDSNTDYLESMDYSD